ncbi:MAG: two-component regulator propeller domain-containing protein [Bacteroidales bacterium]|nr:two-component regulator propeller domain-containing protein [Bacteroidales bacterium]
MRIEKTLSNQTVNSFVEDSLGYIWIGTSRGLNRFNGQDYTQYFTNPDDSLSLSSNTVSCLLYDSHNRLWIGTINGICLYTGNDQFLHIPLATRFQNVAQLLELPNGHILINLIEHLCEYVPETGETRVLIEDFDMDHSYANQCFIDSKGQLWSQTAHHVRCFNLNDLELIHSWEHDLDIQQSLLLPNDELWALAEGNPYVFDLQTGSFLAASVFRHTEKLVFSNLRSIFPMSNHELLFQTSDDMWLYDQSTQSLINKDDTHFPFVMPDRRITLVYQDTRNDLWIGIENQGFIHHHRGQGRFEGLAQLNDRFKGQAIVSLKGEEEVWICTDNLKVFCYDGQQLKEVEAETLTASRQGDTQQLSVIPDRQGNLWVISNGVLMQCIYADGALKVKHTFPEITTSVLSLHIAGDGTVWAGTNTNLLYRLRKGDDHFHSISIDAPQMFISYQLASLRNGCLIIGTALNNPIYLNPETREQKRIPIAEDFTKYDLTTAIAEDGDGLVWIGTFGLGAYRFDPISETVTHINGLPSEEIADIVIDKQGQVWISTLNGLSRVNTQYLTVTNYTAVDGLGGNQYNVGCGTALTDGKLLFGGMHGLTTVNPYFNYEPHYGFINFEHLKVNNHLVRFNPSHTLRLSHKDTNINLSFAFLNYNEQEQTHHFYQLDGFHQQWIDINHNCEIYLSNIPSGHYTLRVRVMDHDQQLVLAENSIDIRIIPAWWNTWWFRSCTIILIVSYLVVFVLYMKNRRRIREILSQATKVDEKAEEVLSTADKQFMDELYALMEAELSNPELNINSLTEKLLMSRSKLNYKVKGLTGETPAAFFKRFKLNKAAELLRSGNHTVSEVADLTGFSSSSVFSRNFKQQFGVSPSEFA